MYKVTRRTNLIPFLLILLVGIAASIYVPEVFHDTKGEIPAFALFPGEIAIALILSVLLFENATPAELIKIAGFMLFIAFLDGALCNLVGGHTIWMPDATLQLNWVQLIAFNATGMGGIMALYTTVSADSGYAATRPAPVKEAPPKETAASKMDFSPQEVAQGNEAKDLINSLDAGRIDKLEQSVNPTAPEKVSLESLFAEENTAASKSMKQTDPAPAPVAPAPEPVAAPPAPEPVKAAEPEPEPFKLDLQFDEPTPTPEVAAAPTPAPEPAAAPQGGLLGDVSGDIEDIFGNLVGEEAQKDFSPAEKAAAEAAAGKAPEPAAPAEPEPAAPEPAPQAPAEAAESFGPKMTDSGTSAKAAVKEFGKLSATAAGKSEAAGTLKTIGQMLLDTAAVEKIIKTAGDKKEGGSKWRVLTVDRGADLQALMDLMTEYEGVESALLMGKDGLLLSNTESLSALKYVFGPLSLAMQSTTNLGTSKLQMGELRQAVLRCDDKLSVLTDVGSAILAVFGNWNLDKLDGLMAHINTAVSKSGALEGELPGGAAPDLSAPAPAAAPVAPPAAAAGGIVNVSDNEMSDLFDNLLDETSADKKKEEAAAAAAAAAPAGGIVNVSDNELADVFDNLLDQDSKDKKKEEAPPAPAAAPAGGLLNVSDKEVGDLFDNLLDEPAKDKGMDFTPADKQAAEAPAPAAAEAPAPTTAEAAPPAKPDPKQDKSKKKPEGKQIKEFGKLSVQASQKDTGTEAGAMKAIGRQLIDVQAVENIIKAGEKREKIGSGLTTARVISAARGEGIKMLLSKIDTHEGVIGSLIVGHDGLVIASTLQGGIDKDMMGAMSTAIHSHLDVAVKTLQKGKLQQCVFYCDGEKLTVMTAVAVGILAVFVDQAGVAQVDGLLNAIETTVRG